MGASHLTTLGLRMTFVSLIAGLVALPVATLAGSPANASCVTSQTVARERMTSVHVARTWRLRSVRRLPGRTVVKVKVVTQGAARFRFVHRTEFCSGGVLRSWLTRDIRARATGLGRGTSDAKPRVRTTRATAAARAAARSKADPLLRSRLAAHAGAAGLTWADSQRMLDPVLVRHEVLRLVNQHRESIGRPLVSDLPGGDVLATQWAEHVARSNILAHDVDPDTGFDDDLRSLNCAVRLGAYAQNAAMGHRGDTEKAVARALVNSWLDSPGHRAAIENGQYRWTTVGFSLLANGGWVAVQRFSGDDCSNL